MSSKTIYGVRGLDNAKILFGEGTRLARCEDGRFHPSNGEGFTHLSTTGFLVALEPPFFVRKPDWEFDQYYSGWRGWD